MKENNMPSNKKNKKGAKAEMMDNQVMTSTAGCILPFDKIDEDGSFKCPKCHTTISPDDETSDNYEILDTKMGADDEISELVIECCTCGTVITLTGSQHPVEA